MPAYLIVSLNARDAAAYEKYKAEAPALIRRHGGQYLVRGGAHEVLEGAWRPGRLVLFRFPDKKAVHAFMNDPDYQPLKRLRQQVAHTDSLVVEGL